MRPNKIMPALLIMVIALLAVFLFVRIYEKRAAEETERELKADMGRRFRAVMIKHSAKVESLKKRINSETTEEEREEIEDQIRNAYSDCGAEIIALMNEEKYRALDPPEE